MLHTSKDVARVVHAWCTRGCEEWVVPGSEWHVPLVDVVLIRTSLFGPSAFGHAMRETTA